MKHTAKTALIPVVLRQQFRVTKTLHRHYCTDLNEIPLKYYEGNLELSDGDSKKFVLWGLPFQCRHPEVTTVKQVKEEGRNCACACKEQHRDRRKYTAWNRLGPRLIRTAESSCPYEELCPRKRKSTAPHRPIQSH